MLSFIFQKVYAQSSEFVTNQPSTSGSGSSFDSILASVTSEIIGPINLLLSAAALLYFLWGVFDFIKNADSSSARDTGIQHMIWGVFGLVTTISVAGVIALIENTLGL